RTLTSPSCAMSRETVACTASSPTSCSASANSSCVDSERSWTSRRIAPWRSNFVVMSQHLPENGQGLVELFVGDGQRRREPEDALAGGADEETALEAGRDHVAGYAVDLEAEQQPGAANLHRGRQALELARQSLALYADIRKQIVVHSLDDGAGRGARDWIAAERARVISGLERAGALVCDEQRADRQAVGQTLRERHGVRLHAEPLPREERPRASDTRLHLVEHEQRTVPVGELARTREDLASGRVDASLPLDRFDKDASGVVVDELGERGRIVESCEDDSRDERLESGPLRRLARHRERAHRAPVERVLERDD